MTDPSAKSSTHLGARPNIFPCSFPVPPMDDDDITYKGSISSTFDTGFGLISVQDYVKRAKVFC